MTDCGIVILDYLMPMKEGVSVLREIREINQKVPVIMFTGHPDTSTIGDEGKLKVNAFVPKSCQHTDTIAALKTVLTMPEKILKENFLKATIEDGDVSQ